eukprot:XP_002258542.1 SICA antigen [Plasmodium knowlesi strain H]
MVTAGGSSGGGGPGGGGGVGGGTVGTTSLFVEWLQKVAADAASSGHGTPVEAGKITGVQWATNPWERQYKEILCEAILEIKYFMNGVGTKRTTAMKKDAVTIEQLTEGKAYSRCTVGTVALATIYGDHCKLKEVMQKIEQEIEPQVKGKLEGHLSKNAQNLRSQLDICEGKVDEIGLMLAKALLQDRIRNWAQDDRKKGEMKRVQKSGEDGKWRVGGTLWLDWGQVCKDGGKDDEEKKKNYLEQNKADMVSFAGLKKNDSDPENDQSSTLGDILTKPELSLKEDIIRQALTAALSNGTPFNAETLTKTLNEETNKKLAENCIQKNSGDGKLCYRLDCMKQLWDNKGGQTPNAEALWEDVRTQATDLVTNVSNNVGSDSDADTLCKDVTCPNDNAADCVSKTTCNIMIKALKEVHKNGKGGPENYQIFRPTFRCVILNALAEKLKERAYKGGYACAVEEGIEEALKKGEDRSNLDKWCNGNGKGNSSCQPCGKQHRVCTGSKIGGKNPLEEVRKELDNPTNSTNIQKTLSTIEGKVTLCDRMNCIIKQLKPADPSNPQNASTISAEKFWTEDVKKLWNELAGAMKDSNWNGRGNGCDQLKGATPSEQTACNYLHAGFSKLKDITASIETDGTKYLTLSKDSSFVQTMGCFLLHAYAKHIQKESICDIENGIKEAFKSWGPITKDNCTNGSSCIQCKWEDKDYDNCKISTNVGTTRTEVKGKLEEIVNKDRDSNITQMLTEINEMTSLCDHMKCIASHLNSSTRQGQTTNADEFWGEAGDVKNLWKELVEEMTKKGNVNGNVNGHCNGLDNPSATAACNYLHAGLKYLEENSTSKGKDGKILDKDPSFRQTMGCFLLHSYAEHMKEKSTCVITAGIKQAFETAGKIGNNVSCQWKGTDYESCTIKTNGGTGTTEQTAVKPKVKKIIEGNDPNTEPIIKNINKMKTLCDGLKCIASHLNSPSSQQNFPNVKDFWEKTGEVGQLWQKLSEEIAQSGDNDNGGHCNTVDDNGSATGVPGRTPTTPERKACQYLSLGFNKLKDLSKPPTSKGTDGKILSKDPSFVQTVGCILLKEYAKQMQSTSNCVIDSGIEKAFRAWNEKKGPSCTNGSPCIECEWNESDYGSCQITTNGTSGSTTQTAVKDKLEQVKKRIVGTLTTNMRDINITDSLCDKLQCAAGKWFQKNATPNGGSGNTTNKKTWCDFWNGPVEDELQKMFAAIKTTGGDSPNGVCTTFGDENPQSVERKACNHITAGLDYINGITSSGSGNGNQLLQRAVGCIALNMYADQIIARTKDSCPIDESKIKEMFDDWNEKNNSLSSPSSSCNGVGGNNNVCFKCTREPNFNGCKLSVDKNLINTTPSTQSGQECTETKDEVKEQMDNLLLNEDKNPSQSNTNSIKSNIGTTLSTITEMTSSFCTQVQCAAKKYYVKVINKSGQSSDVNWGEMKSEIESVFTKLLENMTNSEKQKTVTEYCKDNNWDNFGHKERKTNKAACLLFAAGLKHIYGRGSGHTMGQFNGPSFGQTMGCLFLKEYAKQLKKMAEDKRKGNSWVHPLCDIDEGIKHAFEKSENIMEETSNCKKNGSTNDCFVCKQNEVYDNCKIGNDDIGSKSNELFKDPTKQNQMQQTLENTVCPILLTDLLTPFLPLAPVSIGLSAMAYYLWKYFGPLGKGGARFRRSPTEIPGPSVQEQVLDHVQQDSSHEYQLVKERKPRSTPTRTKRSGRVNRRTIIEIHFEVLDECQKGDTQLNQKDFLELLVQEFMGSEFMEEQVPKEDVLMEGVPLELVPIENVPSLGSELMV